VTYSSTRVKRPPYSEKEVQSVLSLMPSTHGRMKLKFTQFQCGVERCEMRALFTKDPKKASPKTVEGYVDNVQQINSCKLNVKNIHEVLCNVILYHFELMRQCEFPGTEAAAQLMFCSPMLARCPRRELKWGGSVSSRLHQLSQI
jgi:hypothetical protein